MNALTGDKGALTIGPMHDRCLYRLQIHFDTRFPRIEKRDMTPVIDREIGSDQGIEMAQHIAIEGRSNA